MKLPDYPHIIGEHLGERYGAAAVELRGLIEGEDPSHVTVQHFDALMGSLTDALVALKRRNDNLYALAAMHVSEVELRQALETTKR